MSTRDQQKAKYWPTAKADAALGVHEEYVPPECIVCGCVYGHEPDCGDRARAELARLRADRVTTLSRVCQIPDCGCDGTWHP